MSIRHLNYIAMAICLFCLLNISPANATFSIVAIDTATHEIGIAAASCVPGGIIADICHVEPNVGGLIPQAYYIPENRDKGIELLRQNKSAIEIINELVYDDENAYDRQYGVITLQGGMGCFFGSALKQFGTFANSTIQSGIQCAAFSGNNIPDWNGHIVGNTYTIHGNILAGEHILLDMEEAFLNTDGPLPIKLMAALQAAKQIGADSRCDSTSSLCACIKVGRPDDPVDSLMLNINVTNVEGDPIDSLQAEFARQYPPAGQSSQRVAPPAMQRLSNHPNPFNSSTTIVFELQQTCQPVLRIVNMQGRIVRVITQGELPAGSHTIRWNGRDQHGELVSSGVYLYQLLVEDQLIENQKMILLQ